MDPCFTAVKTSSASSALTVAHLIRNIEQLKNKDKLISQLEKDLGRQSWGAAAHFAVLERRRSEGSPIPPGGFDLSPPFRTLPEGSDDPKAFPWTPTSIQTPGDVEDVWTKSMEGTAYGKPDLPSQLKGNKDQNKELVEKCRSFLQLNKELNAQNRAFRESNERVTQDTKKLHELLEHSKLQILQLGRQLTQLKTERNEWEEQVESMEGLRQERVEDKKMINALRKACSDKDRRIELLQHRKKRRRVIESAEKAKMQNAGLKETPFGYEEDDKQQGDGNQSVCSLSSTISDDSVWDEVFSKEEMEKNYQRLMMEQLELQKSHALLQRHTDNLQDPQRENMSKAELQNDLFLSQCRIEQLEHLINEGLQGKSEGLWEERERMEKRIQELNAMVKRMEKDKRRLKNELASVQERNEDMEFRLIELEQFGDTTNIKPQVPCQGPDHAPFSSCPNIHTGSGPPPQAENSVWSEDPTGARVDETSQMMEQFAKELNNLLKGRGRDADSALKKLDGLIGKEKSLESMAHELQMKVISLQKEKNSLQDRLLLVEQSQPGKGGNSASLTEARERQENLALKDAIESQSQLVSERTSLQDQLQNLKAENDVLKHQIEAFSKHQSPQELAKEEHQCKQSTLQSLTPLSDTKASSPKASLSRKSSDRKSKSRDGESPTLSKRRKNDLENECVDITEPLIVKDKNLENMTSSVGDSTMNESMICDNDTGTIANKLGEYGDVYIKMKCMEHEVSRFKKTNDELTKQLQESIMKQMEMESSHQSLLEKVSVTEKDFDMLHKENVALGNQLRLRMEELQFNQDDQNPKVSEVEEFCEDLQDRLREAENRERQLRDKLKLFEKNIEEAETHEMVLRERCEQLVASDNEAKKQIQALRRTELELRDIVVEKDIVEQALRDKVDFLQKAEAASVQRIEELEGVVEDLRQQLDEKSDGKSHSQKEANKITELRHQMTFLETDNKALTARVAELEENEEILRENWRRVADEDFNRTQCLEEKVKMLEGVNRDLKAKVNDAQEYLVINMSESNLSLAAELAESESKIFDDSSDDDDDEKMGGIDEVDSPSKSSGGESEKKAMREKVMKLERQLSEVSEQKNTKIESLQEQLVGLKETEIKLSETISEMEMTERELRAKLALYESSEITVEKMLKYQSKIEELRTSQESLLDQLEIKETQEMTLQEKMQEMERTLRGKIVTLEVEMKGYKQKELKNAGRIRELEKQESELSEKVVQQAEKENGLYVKISSLMDELKTSKTELENVRRQMEDKEDKVRQAKLLEVKLLEIEMECGKKVSTLNAKLRHREEEFRQKESAYEEQILTLKESHDNKSKLEDEFAQKEHESITKLSSLENELENERQKVQEREILIGKQKQEIQFKVQHMESALMEKETEKVNEKEAMKSEMNLRDNKMSQLEAELKEALQYVKKLESEKEYEQEAAQTKIQEVKSFCDKCISQVEKKAVSKLSLFETKLNSMQSVVSDLHVYIYEQCMKAVELETEIEEQRKVFEEDVFRLENEKDILENELKNKISVLKSQLKEIKDNNESEQSIQLKEHQEKEASLMFDVSNLQHQVEQHKHELIAKLSELEAKNKAHCELSLELSNLRHDHKSLQNEIDKSKKYFMDMKFSLEKSISEKDNQLDQYKSEIVQFNAIKEELKSELCHKDEVIGQMSSQNESFIFEKNEMENKFSEKCQEFDKINELHLDSQRELSEIRKSLDDKDYVIQKHEQEKGEKEILLKESQSHVQSAQIHKDSLEQEIQQTKSLLEEAQSQVAKQQEELRLLHSQLQSHQEEIRHFKTVMKENMDKLKDKDQLLNNQQQELQLIKNKIQTHQEEIKKSESLIKQKEEKLQEKDQMYDHISAELKTLHQQLEDRDQELKQAECRVADVELKLQQADNRVRELESTQASLEMRLEERYSVSQNAEKVLLSKEMQCKELENRLEVTEKNLANLKDQISVGNESSKELAQLLHSKQNELEEEQINVASLRDCLEEKKSECLSLESKLKKMETEFQCVDKSYSDEKERLKKLNSDQEVLISSLETRLQERDSNVIELRLELDTTKEVLEEKERCHSEYQHHVTSLQEGNSDLTSKYDDLVLKLSHANKQLEERKVECDELQRKISDRDSDMNRYKEEGSKNAEELTTYKEKLKDYEKIQSEKTAALKNVNEENQMLKDTIEKLSSEKESISAKHYELKNDDETNKSLIAQLQSEKKNMSSSIKVLQKENIDLKDRINVLENEFDSLNSQSSIVTEEKENLSKQLIEVHAQSECFQAKIRSLESDISLCAIEKDKAVQEAKSLMEQKNQLESDNLQLQKEIEEAAEEFQELTLSFEESKSSIESKVEEISKGKQKVEEDLAALQTEHSYQASEMFKKMEGKEKEVQELKQKCEHLSQENIVLTSSFDSLKLELNQAQMAKQVERESVVDDLMVSDTNMEASSAPSLFSAPSSLKRETTTQIEGNDLDGVLNDMKEREKQNKKRLSELEMIEKELREQIVDIEMTVIVPLEGENQDLKDEISMVKQERDEAIAKIKKWGDDDDDDDESSVQESEMLHQRLEDALITHDELEKKNNILLADIQKLENENESLLGKITDLEASESERKDELENLQDELQKLHGVHKDTSVLEETETTLMDRVLDLEERERSLSEELEKIKNGKDGHDMEGLSEKMRYLEQKNQILEDAEGRYMDKIMELEEDKHRLLSKLSSFTQNFDSEPTLRLNNIPHTAVNTISVSISTQTCVPLESDTVSGATDSYDDSVVLPKNPDILSSTSEQTHSSPSNSNSVQSICLLQEQLQQSQSKLEELEAQLREKETVVLYMQDKLELLQDSEGKLMDKLLEAEEKASRITHSKYSAEISELNKKIEQIQEENEFLAENVEQYKKSIKEEKEKCNDLQDRLFEDSSNIAELQRTQEELLKTQQMVEEIQSEYEEQLSEQRDHELHLKEELAQAVKKQNDMEEVLAVKSKREEELQEQVDGLKTTEKELRSKMILMKLGDDDSALSDSGLSADDPRSRNDLPGVQEIEAPTVHRSVKTVLLVSSTPTSSTASNNGINNSINVLSPNTENPVPLTRSERKRVPSTDETSHDELVFLVEDLRDREAALKKRISDLEATDNSDLSQRVVQLESEKLQLERNLRYVQHQNESRSESKTSTKLDQRFSSGFASTPTTMLEKPEDVLNQRIKELEGLDKHNKNMVSELERDREVLHEIARKDKATIHDLNVKIRELQLSERSLKEQVTNLEVSENSFFTKCEELETIRVQLEDRVHELEIHERRLRELVRKLKLDEERWLSKSDGMENAVAELSANEAQLKRCLQDIEMEKGGLSERAEYLEARIRELESLEVTLLARIKDYENNEVTLQNRLVQLENAEAAAHSRVSELDMVNVNLSQQHKKMSEENAVMTQHLAQLHGQVQDLDRRLLSSRDSEIAYKQHVESLQKNESLLQKKVREYELREIDSQSAIRELEQTMEITNDKLSALQRSENRLRYRVQELEGVRGQIPGELTPSQQENVPQKIEDCQKRIVVLQGQVENLKLQLRQALNTTQQQSANKSEDDDSENKNNISLSTEEFKQLHTKAALMEEYAYQNEELELSQEQLRDTILQLRQGKGACGHEVEIEVYKRRIESLQTFISKLKLSLALGQTTSLLEPDQDSGPQGDTLPARHLQVLESERVLQSVRGLHHNGKADTTNTTNGGVHSTSFAPVEESIVQAEAVQSMASLPSSEDDKAGLKPEQTSRLEESHWKAIEARKPLNSGSDSRGGVNTTHGRETKSVSSSPRHNGKQQSSNFELEEVTGFLNLQSESEHSSYHKTTHNDTDSCSSPVPPPRRNRTNRLSKNMSDDNSSGSDRDKRHFASKATTNKKHFGEESLPYTASNIQKQFSSQQQKSPAPLSRFAEDSFYLPSSTQEGVDSLDDDESPPPLPSQGPPGHEVAMSSGRSSRASSTYMQEDRIESLDNSTSGLSIRERIAMIERHLQSDTHTGSQSNRDEEDQLFYWKRKSTESLRQAETLDKTNKFLKEDINRLEKELEEKRRYFNTLELWLSSTEDLLKNKSKQTDREMVEQLQLDLSKLRKELQQSGYRSEDSVLDAAALKTEVEHKDKEISSKRVEIETLAQELKRCHKECRSIEGMRRTALDSLRALEKEVLHLQDMESKLKKAHSEINSMKVQYDELDQFKNQALAMVQPLQMKVDRLAKKCREKDVLLRRLGAELRRGLHRPSSALDELTRLERAMNGEEYNTDNSDSLSDDLSPRLASHKLNARSVSMDELSFYGDADPIHLPPTPGHSPAKRQRPSPYVNSRPRSAEAGVSNLRSPSRGLGNVPAVPQTRQRASGHLPGRGFNLVHEHFVAIADYDPGLYSQSGRPRLELALREGDRVRVTGPMDRLGYCEAECNGRAGLVPTNYLQPVHHADLNGHSLPSAVDGGQNEGTPSVIHIHHGITPPLEFQDQRSSPSGNGRRVAPMNSPRGLHHPIGPDPPHSLCVIGGQDGGLLLAWQPPHMDGQGCNKGFQVIGYMVCVDDLEYQQIPNPQFCQVVIERIDPSVPHQLSVQTLCAGGQASHRVELVVQGILQGDGPPQENGDGPLDTDLSSVLNSIHYTKGVRKKVMALYDYSPEHQSPHDYTAFELTIHAGDVLSVYGEPRQDGFYHGELEGRRGLVPACFVEDVSTARSRRGKHGSEDSGHESSKA